MAFTFLLEDGTGLAAANSYASVEETKDILYTDPLRYAAFNSANTKERENALALASTYLDTRFQWNGSKAVDTSALRWPRDYAYDRDSVLISSTVIPTTLKHATALMASLMLEEKASFSDAAGTTQQYPLTALKVDVISLDFQVPDTDFLLQGERVPDEIKFLLQGLGAPTSAQSAFVKINK
jgi:hypothetical protein